MWVFFKTGFVSVVKVQAGKAASGQAMAPRDYYLDEVMVRSRSPQHLISFGCKPERIITTPHADYGYRVIMDRAEFIEHMLEHMRAIEYGNFKGAISAAGQASTAFLCALNDVWSVMYQFQINDKKGGTK
jgi:hypothetical protein